MAELIDLLNENYNKKQGSDEHTSSLPRMVEKLVGIVPSISEDVVYEVPMTKETCPDLEGYNVHYNEAELARIANLTRGPQNLENSQTITR